MTRTVIIGGGITGLSAAWALRQSAYANQIILLEQNERFGGCIYTEQVDGFLIEHGPDVFLADKPEAIHLCESLGLSLQQTNESHREIYLRCGADMYTLPSGLLPRRIGPILHSPLVSMFGKLRILTELVLPPRTDVSDESVASFFIRRFGHEAFENLFKPLIGGFAGRDVEHLSMKALLPDLQMLESMYGSLILGANRPPIDKLGRVFLSLPDGLSSLVNALHALMKEDLHLGCRVTAIERSHKCWTVHVKGRSSITADHIIFAVPAWVVAKIIQPLSAELVDLLLTIPYRAGTMVHLAYLRTDVKRPLRGHGHLVAPGEQPPISACTWSTNKLMGRSSAEHQLYRLYFQGADLSDSTVIIYAREEMNKALNITAAPMLTRVYRYPATLPQYQLGHQDKIRQIQRLIQSFDGLCLAGNYIDGLGISDCIRNGTLAAQQSLQKYS